MFATYQTSSSFGEGDGALLTGNLVENAGCLVVETDDGSTVLPIFPSNTTTWDAATNALTLDGTGHPLGNRVSFGGGYTSHDAENADLPEACGKPEEAFMVSSTDATGS